MNKSEFIEVVAQEAGISKAAAAKAVEGVTAAITKVLKEGGNVTLIGFGTFYVSERKERTGRNPRTGKALTIPARKAPSFRPGKSLKDML